MKPVRGVLLAVLLTLPLVGVPAAAAPPGPVFVDGQAQPVFDPDDVIREDVWVRAPVDSDHDGRDDEVHVQVVRPRATEQGLRVPVVYQVSPYYAGGNPVTNHDVDVELYVPDRPGHRDVRTARVRSAGEDERLTAVGAGPTAAVITSHYEPYFVARGFAMVYAEALGSGQSTGCPTTGGRNETLGARAVVDWLNGRASARDAAGNAVRADWATGRTGMIGVSYNGTLPNAVATTGVEGLAAIVPIAAISNWYDYYRAGGAVVAPGGYQGEDADVLAEYVYTREDREICRPVIAELARRQDRLTGDYNRFWDERNYLGDVDGVRAAVLVVHGLNDWNVKTRHAAQWYEELKRYGVPHKIWWHQSGHTDPYNLRRDEWLSTLNRWFTRYLYGVSNRVEHEPRAVVQREDGTWTEEVEWPPPGTADAVLYPRPGGRQHGALTSTRLTGAPVVEGLVDDAGVPAEELASAPSSENRLAYLTGPARTEVRISGTVRVLTRMSFDRPAANVTALLVDRAPDGSVHVITRGWVDPQNRRAIDRTQAIRPGQWYRIEVELQPDDYLVRPGHQLGMVLLSSDHDFTLRPGPGTELSVDLNHTQLVLPVVGGPGALLDAIG
ncbi:MAG TPA: Xaa-Pro dipeptidyl-peptidase [Pseudonocardiaceae bacterium]